MFQGAQKIIILKPLFIPMFLFFLNDIFFTVVSVTISIQQSYAVIHNTVYVSMITC